MILLIDNYDSFTYNLYQLLADTEVKVARNDKISIDEIKALNPQGIILSPGPGRPEQAGICLDVIKHFAEQTPILGVCLGHQAIGQAFGGTVEQAPEIVHGKASYIFHNNQDLLHGLPQPFKATRYHSLCVARHDLPAELIVTAEDKEGLIMGLKHQSYPCFGVQFHPESIISEHGKQLLMHFVKFCEQHNKEKA